MIKYLKLIYDIKTQINTLSFKMQCLNKDVYWQVTPIQAYGIADSGDILAKMYGGS